MKHSKTKTLAAVDRNKVAFTDPQPTCLPILLVTQITTERTALKMIARIVLLKLNSNSTIRLKLRPTLK